ncbi:MAG: signal peptidase I [Anaerocolumna aminovalerica]|jgi:signal peptidase I|uniref:signal peptidase I n=1 Tax=Anaerocolumna aminovalerica TaxID=1527 RepID=UPI002911DDEE|nr:signal peptidase I [Anaerocolumna aminovalerica]MDU6263651.1 signal peptidase I [Anaerocolumna aminovalerica]
MDKNKKSEILSWIKIVVSAFVVALVINNFIIVKAEVPTGSMENTVMTHDQIVGYRLAYLFSTPKRGDIIMFPFPDDESTNYLKRIIGLPGEVIEIIDGKVYINGSTEPLKEDYLKEEPKGSYGPYTVPEDSYFMMGDNRNSSLDSRVWEHPFVKKEKIIGKAVFRYSPKIGFIE